MQAPPTPSYEHDQQHDRSPHSSYSRSYESQRLDSAIHDWNSQRGLGLMPAPSAFGPMTTTNIREPCNMNTMWPSYQLSVPAMNPSFSEMCRDWSESPSSLPTSAIAENMWSSLPNALSVSTMQPVQSISYEEDYCTPSTRSPYSSPYAHAAHLSEATPSPYIKPEPQYDVSSIAVRSAQVDQRVVNPMDIVTQPPPPTPHITYSPVFTPRTNEFPNPRARSDTAETKLSTGSRQHRRRCRTTPENATCFCEICHQPFARQSNLVQHMHTHEANRARPYKCSIDADCTYAFQRRTDLDRHIKSVSNLSITFVIVLISYRCTAS